MGIWRKILRRLGFVKYEDYMIVRDALACACNSILDADSDSEKDSIMHPKGEWLESVLHNATVLCDYPKVWEGYTDEMKKWRTDDRDFLKDS